jgi:hypothetical protein
MVQTLNGHAVPNTADSYGPDVAQYRIARATYDFAVDGGAQGVYTMYTVTGDVYCTIVSHCHSVSLDSLGAATIELGIAGNTAALIAQTLATDLDVTETWQDATPEPNPGAIIDLTRTFQLLEGADIIFTIGTADLTAGDIIFTCLWFPVTTDGNVIAA